MWNAMTLFERLEKGPNNNEWCLGENVFACVIFLILRQKCEVQEKIIETQSYFPSIIFIGFFFSYYDNVIGECMHSVILWVHSRYALNLHKKTILQEMIEEYEWKKKTHTLSH